VAKARGRKQPERASDRYERMALKALEESPHGEGNATAKSAAARLVLDRGRLELDALGGARPPRLHEEQQAQLNAALPATRERPTVLIERRAGTLAEEMYEERTRVETEAVKTEPHRNDSFSERGCCPCSRGAALGLGICRKPVRRHWPVPR
jgi:hypothetical protein